MSLISSEDFVREYMLADSIEMLIPRLSILAGHSLSRKSVVQRASRYRKEGVQLKELR